MQTKLYLSILYVGCDSWNAVKWKRALSVEPATSFRQLTIEMEMAEPVASNQLLLKRATVSAKTLEQLRYSIVVVDLPFGDLAINEFQSLHRLLETMDSHDTIFIISVAPELLGATPWLTSIGFDLVVNRCASVEITARRAIKTACKYEAPVHPFVNGLKLPKLRMQ